MRISDWSSDVCSSDLLSVMQCINDAEFALFGHMDIDFRRRNIVREGREELLGRGFLFAEDLQQARGAVDAIVKTEQIGRASCRERVCHTCRSRWSPYH